MGGFINHRSAGQSVSFDNVFLNDLFDPPSLPGEGGKNASRLHY